MLTERDVTRYRIYTEDITPTDKRLAAMGITPDVLVALAFGVTGYTRFQALGTWAGSTEASVVFEILAAEEEKPLVLKVAKEIQARCGQAAVIVTADRVQEYTLTGE